MVYCGHWLSSVAYFVLWIAFFCSVVSLFAPLWYSTGDPPSMGYGLYLNCHNPYYLIDEVLDSAGNLTIIKTTCQWRDIGRENTAWFTACQALWATGTGVLLIVAFTSFFVCCDSCRRASCQNPVFGATLFACILFIITDTIFGVYHYNKMAMIEVRMKRDHLYYFDWGYYIAIATAGTSFLSAILFGSVSLCVKNKSHEYEMKV